VVSPPLRYKRKRGPEAATSVIPSWLTGEEGSLDRLAEQVYAELRLMARRLVRHEAQGHSLQATALVHEVYLRLVGVGSLEWRERAQFFGLAARMMRRILVDAARAKHARKRGSRAIHVTLDGLAVLAPEPDNAMIAVDDALKAFAAIAPRQAQVVELRYFGGLTEAETAALMGTSARTVRRDWELARVWLARELDGPAAPPA
jgi:RNA polymerase sigma factor (TIGR02999 family)